MAKNQPNVFQKHKTLIGFIILFAGLPLIVFLALQTQLYQQGAANTRRLRASIPGTCEYSGGTCRSGHYQYMSVDGRRVRQFVDPAPVGNEIERSDLQCNSNLAKCFLAGKLCASLPGRCVASEKSGDPSQCLQEQVNVGDRTITKPAIRGSHDDYTDCQNIQNSVCCLAPNLPTPTVRIIQFDTPTPFPDSTVIQDCTMRDYTEKSPQGRDFPNDGSRNDWAWPHVKTCTTWCAGGNVYMHLTWNSGYGNTGDQSLSGYRLDYVSVDQSPTLIQGKKNVGSVSANATVDSGDILVGNTSVAKGRALEIAISNGWYTLEYGWPHKLVYSSTCTNATGGGRSGKIPQ